MLGAILSGLKVVDLTQNVAGPFCTQVLGDMGATVIKVERPGRGDDTRDWPPQHGDQSATFLALNRNKSSICLDLDHPEGLVALRRLAGDADILIHSMKPGSAESRGLGHAKLAASNPRLIYCAISAFGQAGPLAALPGYDPLMQAFTGIMSTTGNEGDDPVRVAVSLIDIGTGMWAALGVLAGVIERGRSGRGMLVEASLLDTGIGWMSVFVATYLATGKLPRKLGSGMAMAAPYQLFPARDGHVFIAAGNDGLFQRVCAGLDCRELAGDVRFATNAARVANREALVAAISTVTRQLPAADIVARLRTAGAPCSELNSVAQMLAHPQVEAAGIIADLPAAEREDHRIVALPLKLGGERSARLEPPPALGADTVSLLSGLGYAADEIERLRIAGAIG
ncbi:CaiB/BaiF CoA transferase family protein [Bosea sp. (in: a-proteobacteria)]